jgi:hypothetical protein
MRFQMWISPFHTCVTLASAATAQGTLFNNLPVFTTYTLFITLRNSFVRSNRISNVYFLAPADPHFTLKLPFKLPLLLNGNSSAIQVTFVSQTEGTFGAALMIDNEDADAGQSPFRVSSSDAPQILNCSSLCCRSTFKAT